MDLTNSLHDIRESSRRHQSQLGEEAGVKVSRRFRLLSEQPDEFFEDPLWFRSLTVRKQNEDVQKRLQDKEEDDGSFKFDSTPDVTEDGDDNLFNAPDRRQLDLQIYLVDAAGVEEGKLRFFFERLSDMLRHEVFDSAALKKYAVMFFRTRETTDVGMQHSKTVYELAPFQSASKDLILTVDDAAKNDALLKRLGRRSECDLAKVLGCAQQALQNACPSATRIGSKQVYIVTDVPDLYESKDDPERLNAIQQAKFLCLTHRIAIGVVSPSHMMYEYDQEERQLRQLDAPVKDENEEESNNDKEAEEDRKQSKQRMQVDDDDDDEVRLVRDQLPVLVSEEEVDSNEEGGRVDTHVQKGTLWDHVISVSARAQDLGGPDSLRGLVKHLKSAAAGARASISCALHLGRKTALAVRLYPLSRERTIKTVRVNTDNRQLRLSTRYLNAATGQESEKPPQRYSIQFGEQKVPFTQEERKELNYSDRFGLQLLGFRPRDQIKSYYQMRASYFLMPDESRIEGSTAAYSALLQACVKKRKVPVVRFLFRPGTAVRIAALIPEPSSLKKAHAEMEECRPHGFHMVVLPYADDVRPFVSQSKLEVSLGTPVWQDPQHTELKKAAAEVVEAATLSNFRAPFHFWNPRAARRMQVITARALDQSLEDLPIRETQYDDNLLRKTLQSKPELAQAAAKFAEAMPAPLAKTTRKSHKVQIDPEALNAVFTQYKEEASSDFLGKKKVAELKTLLEAAGKPRSGRKADLVERLDTYLANRLAKEA